MRNSTGGNSTSAKKSQQNAVVSSEEKNSAKKLVQARLPFKVIASGSSPTDGGHIHASENDEVSVQSSGSFKESTDGRKRKLSYSSDSDDKSKERTDTISKENVAVQVAGTKKKKLSANKIEAEIISLLDDDEIIDEKSDNEDGQNVTTSTSKAKSISKNIHKIPVENKKSKGAGTPKLTTPKAHKEKNGSATKLQIKLPLSAGKKSKRRKSKVTTFLANTSNNMSDEKISCAESSDDIEEVSNELNPNKRSKIELPPTEDNADSTIHKKSESINCKSKTDKNPKVNDLNKVIKETLLSNSSRSETTIKNLKSSIPNGPVQSEDEQNESIIIASDDNDNDDDDIDTDAEEDEDADDETENKSVDVKGSITSDGNEKNSNEKENSTLDSLKISDKHKTLTPKQKQLMERRQMARLEKERKLLEEKQKKQQEKEEKESARKREREEKEDQKRKEREEKEEQRRKEREEKERKRLAEIEAKNEEKRKKNEAKEEELRKKEDERKRKELEKEEVELKKRKAAQAFTKFFVAKTTPSAQQTADGDENTGDGIKTLAFRPFQIKGDMHLAPICRNALTPAAKNRLESFISCFKGSADNDGHQKVSSQAFPKSKLYINELKSGHIIPGKWRRPSTESKDEVVIVEDELERVGQEIVEDTPAYVREEMRVKFYKFHDNRRPAYYGTFRKKSQIVSGRKPLAQDTKFFDYEVDSDDEWEEEEPGESLEDGSDDDKEKESEDEDYEVDNEWFVPHGHLSEEELQNEDEFGLGDDNTREAQKAKLQLIQQEFAQEMKKKTEKIKPRLIGCIWANANGTPPQECPNLIWETLGKRSMLYSDPPVVEEPKVDEPASPTGPSVDKLKPIKLSDKMTKDLVRLVHGNNNSKNFLIKEYIAYLEKTEESIKNGEFCNIAKSVIREKIDSFAEWQAVARSPSRETSNDNGNKKKKNKKRLCWVVNSEVLDKMDMSPMNLNNTWEYTLNPRKGLKTDEPLEPLKELETKTDKAEDKSKTAIGTVQITKYTKSLTEEEKTKNLQDNAHLNRSPAQVKPETKTKIENKTSKEKKRVPLLISVARGQQISTPAKNKLISQFLHKEKKDSNNSSIGQESKLTKLDDDDVVILD